MVVGSAGIPPGTYILEGFSGHKDKLRQGFVLEVKAVFRDSWRGRGALIGPENTYRGSFTIAVSSLITHI